MVVRRRRSVSDPDLRRWPHEMAGRGTRSVLAKVMSPVDAGSIVISVHKIQLSLGGR